MVNLMCSLESTLQYIANSNSFLSTKVLSFHCLRTLGAIFWCILAVMKHPEKYDAINFWCNCFYQVLEEINKWTFDVFKLHDLTQGHPLLAVTYTILQVSTLLLIHGQIIRAITVTMVITLANRRSITKIIQ